MGDLPRKLNIEKGMSDKMNKSEIIGYNFLLELGYRPEQIIFDAYSRYVVRQTIISKDLEIRKATT